MSSTAILLIHGFGGGARDYRALKGYLLAQKHNVEFFEFFYDKKYGQVSISDLAENLAAYIQEHLGKRKFFAVGFSQGGLIFRRFASYHLESAQQVLGAITIYTPHQGSLVAHFGFGKGIEDLKPRSKMLCELADFDDGIPYYAVYNPYDPVVVPGTNAKYKRATVNKRVATLSHYLTFRDKKTLLFIENILFPVRKTTAWRW